MTAPSLERIVAEPARHERFVNALARMEYVGVRKMLESRRAEAFYPRYEAVLRAANGAHRAASSVSDELRRLAEMEAAFESAVVVELEASAPPDLLPETR